MLARTLGYAAVLLFPMVARAAHYVIKPVVLPRGTGAVVTAVATDGTLAGYFFNAKGVGEGFEFKSSKFRVLPNLSEDGSGIGIPMPQSVLPDGSAAGIASTGGDASEAFVWQGGKYSATFPLGQAGGSPRAVVNRGGTVLFDSFLGDYGYDVEAGVPPNFSQITSPGSNPYGVGINRAGTVSGTFVQNQNNLGAWFLYSGGNYTTITVPDAYFSAGGLVNDKGDLAGIYDTVNTYLFHGFVYHHGKIRKFSVPEKATYMSLGGFSNTGYIAGLYGNYTNPYIRGFVYRNGTLNIFGHWPTSQIVTVAGVSDAGVVAFTVNGASFTATCTGDGC